MKKDALGDRIKNNFENRTRYFLPRRCYYIIRIDGKSFHSYTKKFKRPFDLDFMSAMDNTALNLCANMQGAVCAYVQSDEITILLTDFAKITTDAWFDGNISKICSISASMATGFFLQERAKVGDNRLAFFDSRVFSMADCFEAENTLIWRQMDCTRNSIQMVAQSLYSHKELMGKNTSEQQDLIWKKNINWDKLPIRQKRGSFIMRVPGDIRNPWGIVDPPVFTKNRKFLRSIIPLIPNFKDIGDQNAE